MSLSDITLNSRVYSAKSWTGSSGFTRGLPISSVPENAIAATLEISHDFSKGTKPNRSLVKLTRTVEVDGVPYDISLHAVITVPKGPSYAQVVGQLSGTAGMADDLADLLSQDTYAFTTRMYNGEFS